MHAVVDAPSVRQGTQVWDDVISKIGYCHGCSTDGIPYGVAEVVVELISDWLNKLVH